MVQPLFVSSTPSCSRFEKSVRVDVDKYDINIIGITVSFAGNPRIKAKIITPSNPKSRPNGSKKFEQ